MVSAEHATKTPSVGDKLSLTITDVAFGGEGIGRWEGFVLFVPFVAPGEEVEVAVTEVKKTFGRARLLRVLTPAPQRVQPLCPYFGECGGCQYQHLAYPVQLSIKHKQVCEIFQRIGGFDPGLVAPVIPCPAPYGYRNRIMIRSQWDKFKQGLNIGYIRADSRLVIDIEECKIAEPALSAQIKNVRAHPPPKGGLKVVLRIPPEGWEVPPDSFFQNNFSILPKLVETVRNLLASAGSRHLIDVFCGVGFFAIECADLVTSFAGVELDRMAIAAAKRNAASRQIMNGRFVAGAAEEKLPEIVNEFSAEDTTILLDPPRKGCLPQTLEMLRQVRPRQIIYVSCHPATMARDLNVLCSEGVFKLTQVIPADLFPQTSHIECVADVRAAADPASPRGQES